MKSPKVKYKQGSSNEVEHFDRGEKAYDASNVQAGSEVTLIEQEDYQLGKLDSFLPQQYLKELSKCEICKTTTVTPMRWYRIDKIVMEKGVFFGDKLSMLYMALHECSKNVVLVLNKNIGGSTELYLGARDFEGKNAYSGEILKSGLKGYLPGVKFVQANNLHSVDFTESFITSVSSLASLRDDKKENFVQGLEKLINATVAIPCYRAYFIAEHVSEKQAYDIIKALGQIYTSLSPLKECQVSLSESHTDGISESVSKGISDTISSSISKTITHSEGHSKTISEEESSSFSETTQESPNIFKNIWHTIVGGETGSSETTQYSSSTSSSSTHSQETSVANGETKGKEHGVTEDKQKGWDSSDTRGINRQITCQNRNVEYYLDLMDDQIDRLNNGIPFGLWSVASYFVAPQKTSAIELANLYRGCVIGEESNLGTCAINFWSEQDKVATILDCLYNSSHPRFSYKGEDVSAGVTVTSKELAIHLSLPQSSVPGILVREEQCFGTNVISSLNNALSSHIELGDIVHLGQENENQQVNIDIDSLCKHTFVTGTTGSGKSNAIYLLLQELYDKGYKFLVIEPAKGEYKKIFGNKESVHVYGSNPTQTQLLRINPFSFEDGIHVYEHIDRLVEIFNACWPMYAAMPVVLKKSITDAYRKCGWDLDSSTQNIKAPSKLFPTFKDVVVCLRDFINSSEYSAETKGDYKGSLETRLLSMSEGLTGMMLNNSAGNLSDKDLFKQNVIIDLSRVGNTETKSLIMGLIIMKMSEFYQIHGSMNSSLNHVTVLEEAHNILKRTSTTQLQESSNLAGKSVEMICNSIAEMRTYGEGFIIADQSPSQVDMAAIRNTNTKLIMALPEAEDREVAGKSIGLTDEQIEEIGRQKVGEAIVYQNDWEEAVRCKIRKYEYDDKYSYYKKKDTYQEVDTRNALRKILLFLFSYCNDGVFSDRIDDLRSYIIDSRLMSSDKYSLLKLLDDYEQNGVDMSKTNHIKLMETVASILGLSAQIEKLLSVKNNAIEINDAIKKQMEDNFPNEDDSFYRFCIRCSLRGQASKSKRITEIYNNWIKQYCSK